VTHRRKSGLPRARSAVKIDYLDTVWCFLEGLDVLYSLYVLDSLDMVWNCCYGRFVERSGRVPMEDAEGQKLTRGKGRGSSFLVLSRSIWAKLHKVQTENRLTLYITYLVLLAGTGSDHRLTKWSAKAIEDYTGIGKPRAKRAIEELIAARIIKRTAASTRLSPQYELPAVSIEEDAIFLPVQLITGLDSETPILRRVREIGDPLALRMLIDLYGLIQLDATHGVPIENLRLGKPKDEASAYKISETGTHAIWALQLGNITNASGDWAAVHRQQGTSNNGWAPLWDRLDMLKRIGAIWYEPWVFDGEELDAEPIIPVDPAVLYNYDAGDDEAKLTKLAFDTCRALLVDREYMYDSRPFDVLVPLTVHRKTPALRSVARLRVEADTPGRRLAYKKRRLLIEQHLTGFSQIMEDAEAERFDRPMRTGTVRGS
jgi:hypothetical protein